MITNRHIVLLMLYVPGVVTAQTKKANTNMLWSAYYNTIHFNKNFSLVSDAQLRTRDWSEKWSQILIRSGLDYKINDHVDVTGGFAFFKNAQYSGKELFLKNEWRPWQEVAYHLKIFKINFTQKLRTEQRFLQQVVNNRKANRYDYKFRLRYRFEWLFHLKGDKIMLPIGNEVLINPAWISTTQFFDQNRTFAAILFKWNSNTSVQFQYLKIFQWKSNISTLEDQNVIRVSIHQQFILNKDHDSK